MLYTEDYKPFLVPKTEKKPALSERIAMTLYSNPKFKLPVYDAENPDDLLGEVTQASMFKAFQIVEKDYFFVWQHLTENTENFDATDADIIFQRPDWAEETIQQLQIHDFIQPWSHAQDLDPDGAPLNKKPEISFCYAWYNDMEMEWNHKKYSSGTGHPGYAWAARRDALDKMGGLIDFAVLGSGDRHMAYGLVDKIEFSVHPNVHPNYLKHLKYWQVRARHFIHRNVGYLPGMITHHWHGSKKSRGYKDRWQILVNNQYNPELDLKKTTQGVNVLTERNWKLRHDIIRYFESRSEDSIDVE
jgi:hypothetical protein